MTDRKTLWTPIFEPTYLSFIFSLMDIFKAEIVKSRNIQTLKH